MSTGQASTDMDEEALLRDVDGKTDDGLLGHDDVILEDDEFGIEDDEDGSKASDDSQKNAAQNLAKAKPGERTKITFEDPKPAKVVKLEPSNPATVLARQKRQERFGTVIPDKDAEMKLKRAQRFGIVNDNVAKLARIARFGEVKEKPAASSAKPETTAPAAARGRRQGRAAGQKKNNKGSGGKDFDAFNLAVMETTKQKQTVKTELSKEQEERKKQRELRFKAAASGAGAKASTGTPADDEKKLSRAQRFGLA